jgi:hypothetical protein
MTVTTGPSDSNATAMLPVPPRSAITPGAAALPGGRT